jgi:glycerol-3-phosphate O-acyltransferase
MATWLPLNSVDLDERHDIQIGTTRTASFLSPYEIPRAVRCYFRPSEGKLLVVQLDYLDTHEQVKRFSAPGEPVAVLVGRHSKRIWALEINASLLSRPDELAALATEGINNFIHSPVVRDKRTSNYQIVSRVIREHAADLFYDVTINDDEISLNA